MLKCSFQMIVLFYFENENENMHWFIHIMAIMCMKTERCMHFRWNCIQMNCKYGIEAKQMQENGYWLKITDFGSNI